MFIYIFGLFILFVRLSVCLLCASILVVCISLFRLFNFLCEKDITTKISRKVALDFQKDEEIDRIDGWGSLAKFVGTDAGITNCRMALEIMGQAGVRQDNRAEKMLRDVKLLQIYEGTNQINRINLFKRLVVKSCSTAPNTFSSSNL